MLVKFYVSERKRLVSICVNIIQSMLLWKQFEMGLNRKNHSALMS